MSEKKTPKQPTDHLPPVDERESDDQRTTDQTYPGDDTQRPGHTSVTNATAAEPEKPARHGVAKLPPGPH